MNVKTFSRMMVVALGPMLLLSTGCIATRKFVRNTTTPIDSRVTKVDQKVDQKTAQNAQDIRALDDKTEHTDRGALEALLNAFAENAEGRPKVQHEPKRASGKGAPTLPILDRSG